MEESLSGLAQAAAVLGSEFIDAAKRGEAATLDTFFEAGSTAHLQFQIFGLPLVRLDLRLDDEREQGRLAPYDLQIEDTIGLLELGVLEAFVGEDLSENNTTEERQHLRRIFGSSLLLGLNSNKDGWRVVDILPVNSDGTLDLEDEADKHIAAAHRGEKVLELQTANLDEVEKQFLTSMQQQGGKFNLEEMVNAVRLWRDFNNRGDLSIAAEEPAWAAGVEFLITLFDYNKVDIAQIAAQYKLQVEAIEDCAREIAQNLNVSQFDDRYSLHPDPISHYKALFRELGVNPEKDDERKRKLDQVFDTVEVPPDDTDFYGPS